MSVLLKTYLGTNVYVNEKGQFTARVKVWGSDSREEEISNRDLREVEKAIEQARPIEATDFRPITAMRVDSRLEYGGAPTRVTIAGARRENVGRGRNAQVSEYLIDETGTKVWGHGYLYVHDAQAARELAALVEAWAALAKRWEVLVKSLTRIDTQAIVKATVKTIK